MSPRRPKDSDKSHEGEAGFELEQFSYEYFAEQFGERAVRRYPGVLRTFLASTVPDLLIDLPGAERGIYIDVTGSPWNNQSQPKADVRAIFANVARDSTVGGLVLYQQHLITVDGLNLSTATIRELAEARISNNKAQERLDVFTDNYPYTTYRATDMDWATTLGNLRKALGMKSG